MEVTRHSIDIKASRENIYKICADVERWPEYFPPCKAAKILSQENNVQLIEITAQAKESEWTWQSKRILYPSIYRIEFQQVKPSPLVTYAKGIWNVIESERGTLLSLEHMFEIKNDVKGLVENVETKEDAAKYIYDSIKSNSTTELNSIKNLAEKMELSEDENIFVSELEINASAKDVYDLLFDAKKWPDLLPHCEKIEMLYDDGYNQEFIMTIRAGNGNLETMRSIRHGHFNKMVEYFQPEPPPILKSHTGQWSITKRITGEGVVLKSWHHIKLSPKGVKKVLGDVSISEALEKVTNAIDQNSQKTMETIKTYLKG